MKALFLTGRKRFSLRNIGRPPSPPGSDVMIRVRAVGICGSDLHYYLHGTTTSEKPEYPFLIGHECSGEVCEAGPSVRGLRPGDRVFVEPNVACGKCDMCRQRRYNLCRKPKFLGYPGQMEGALREFVVMPSSNCFRFGNGFPFEQALMAEPLSIALYALSLAEKTRIRTAAVLGCGSIGLCLIKAMRVLAPKVRLFATDIVRERLDLARANGCREIMDSAAAVKGILRATDGLGVDAVFECAGVPETIDQSLRILKPGGTLFVIGIPAEPVIRLNTDLFRKKGLTVLYVRRQNLQVKNALRMILSGRIGVSDITGPAFPIEKADQAFRLKIRNPGKTVKPVILPAGDRLCL